MDIRNLMFRQQNMAIFPGCGKAGVFSANGPGADSLNAFLLHACFSIILENHPGIRLELTTAGTNGGKIRLFQRILPLPFPG